MLAVVEKPLLVVAQHLDSLFHWFQAASHGVVRPGFEEAFGSAHVVVAPEPTEVLLYAPGATRLQIELVQGTERDCLVSTRPTQVDCQVAFRFGASSGADADPRSGCSFGFAVG